MSGPAEPSASEPPAPPGPNGDRPGIWSPFLAYLVLFGLNSTFGAGLLLVMILVRWWEQGRLDLRHVEEIIKGAAYDPRGLAVGMVVWVGLSFLVTRWLVRRPGRGGFRALGVEPSRRGLTSGALALLTMLGLGHLFERATVGLGWYEQSALKQISDSTAAAPLFWLIPMVLFGGLAGVTEELFFRGYMQRRFGEHWSRRRAILVTAGCFGILHVDPLHVLYATAVGLFLGWVADREEDTFPSILAHAGNTVVAFLGPAVLPTDFGASWPEVGVSVAMVLVGGASLLARGGKVPNGPPPTHLAASGERRLSSSHSLFFCTSPTRRWLKASRLSKSR